MLNSTPDVEELDTMFADVSDGEGITDMDERLVGKSDAATESKGGLLGMSDSVFPISAEVFHTFFSAEHERVSQEQKQTHGRICRLVGICNVIV